MTCKPRRSDGLLAGGNEGLKCPSRAYSTFNGSTPISVPKKKGNILSDAALCVYDIEEIA